MTHWDFISGGGTEGADRIQFTSGNLPANGALITSDLNGYLRIKGRFNEDSLNEELFEVDLYRMEVKILEVQW